MIKPFDQSSVSKDLWEVQGVPNRGSKLGKCIKTNYQGKPAGCLLVQSLYSQDVHRKLPTHSPPHCHSLLPEVSPQHMLTPAEIYTVQPSIQELSDGGLLRHCKVNQRNVSWAAQLPQAVIPTSTDFDNS